MTLGLQRRGKDGCAFAGAMHCSDATDAHVRFSLSVLRERCGADLIPSQGAEKCLELLKADFPGHCQRGGSGRKRKYVRGDKGEVGSGVASCSMPSVSDGEEYRFAEASLKRLGDESLCSLSASAFGSFPPGPSVFKPGSPSAQLVGTASVHVGGYYTKMERGMTQTPDFHRPSMPTLSTAIARELEAIFMGSGHKFGSAGREDEDVRMLACGRPFLIEILNPLRRSSGKEALGAGDVESQIFINTLGGCTVRRLKICSKAEIELLRGAEEVQEKRKCYQAVVWSSVPLNDETLLNRVNDALSEGMAVSQRTPVRVMHRRALLSRTRMVYNGRLRPLSCGSIAHPVHFGVLDVETQGGTYIKELVHGDLGRTTPSLASLIGANGSHLEGATVDILQLDVTKVIFDWI